MNRKLKAVTPHYTHALCMQLYFNTEISIGYVKLILTSSVYNLLFFFES